MFDALWTLEERERCRKTNRTYKDFVVPWNKGNYNNRHKVGELMDSIRKCEPASHEEWMEYYFTQVKSPSEIRAQVYTMAQREQLDPVTALNWWFSHIIDSAYNGNISEIKIMPLLREYAALHGWEARWATKSEDIDEGVDVVIFDPKTGKIILGVQIKVISYFLSTRETVVDAREVYNPKKYLKFQKRTNAEVWYVIIEKTLETGKLSWKRPNCFKQQDVWK